MDKKLLDQLNGAVIKGSMYKKGKVFDVFSLQLEKDGRTFYFNMALRYLLHAKVEKKELLKSGKA